MTGLVIYKMTGSGNDFVMVDGRTTGPEAWPAGRIRAICDRRQGVGGDGLVVVNPAGSNNISMIYYNCDGSRAAMCGNAALCSTRLAAHLAMSPGSEINLITDAGTYRARCCPEPDRAEINLAPFRAPVEVPGIALEAGESWIGLATVGVPHLVVIVQNVEAVDVMRRGRALRFHPAIGPAGANVNFVSAPTAGGAGAGAWPLRTYERGVEGETLACGTGAVAAAGAIVGQGAGRFPIEILARSGSRLGVAGRLEKDQVVDVWLSGEGRLIFRAVVE